MSARTDKLADSLEMAIAGGNTISTCSLSVFPPVPGCPEAVWKSHNTRTHTGNNVWLDTYCGNSGDETLICPENWADVSKSVRRRAGWDVVARLLNDQVKGGKLKQISEPTRGKWPANACRHTCASVQVAIGTPLEELTFKFGHSGGHDLLRRHYVSRLSKKDAITILSTGPRGTKIDILNAA